MAKLMPLHLQLSSSILPIFFAHFMITVFVHMKKEKAAVQNVMIAVTLNSQYSSAITTHWLGIHQFTVVVNHRRNLITNNKTT